MRSPMVVGNWETGMALERSVELATALRKSTTEAYDVEVVVCPPSPSLAAVKGVLEGSPIKIGAQDSRYGERSADGEGIVAPALSDLCEYAVLGYSQQRRQSDNSDDVIHEEMAAVSRTSLVPILCVGEGMGEKAASKANAAVARQLTIALNGVSLSNSDAPVIVYEPVWAMAEGREVAGKQANDAALLIRSTLTDLYDAQTAEAVRVLYGGRITPDTASEFIEQSEIDGVFVGSASMDAEEFADIIYLAEYVYFPNNPPIKDLIPW